MKTYRVDDAAKEGKEELPAAAFDGVRERADRDVVLPEKVERNTDEADRRGVQARVVVHGDIKKKNVKQRIRKSADDKGDEPKNIAKRVLPSADRGRFLILQLFLGFPREQSF